MKEGRIFREREPIGIRRKDFWDIQTTSSLLGEKFREKLGHEPDGLIFQPVEEVTYSRNKLCFSFLIVYCMESHIKLVSVRRF